MPSSPSGLRTAASGSASCAPVQFSTSGADRIISSTPKPGSSSPSFSSNSFISFGQIAIGAAGADRRAVDRAVDAIERDLELARADARLLELLAQRGKQAAGRGGDVLGPADRLGEGEPRAESGRRAARLDRLVDPAQRLVEASERRVAEAAGERRARQGIEIADAAQAELEERLEDRLVEAQAVDRQRGEGVALAFGGAEKIGLLLGEARQRPGGARGVGHRRAAGEVVAAQALGQIGQQRAFASLAGAEQMAAAGDVEQQAGIAAEAAGAAGFGVLPGRRRRPADRSPPRACSDRTSWPASRSGGGRPAARPAAVTRSGTSVRASASRI